MRKNGEFHLTIVQSNSGFTPNKTVNKIKKEQQEKLHFITEERGCWMT
jgi:hypothetical protein